MINTVTSILPPVHGGRTKALLSRIRLLDQHLGIQNKIYTTNYNANYLEVYHQFREEGTVTPSTTFENMYDWLSGFKLLNIPTTKFRKKTIYHETNRDIEGLTYKVSDDGNVVRYYNEKTYVLYRKYYENTDIVQFEDVMSPISKKKIERREFNQYGQMHRKTFYSRQTFRKIMEEYIDQTGNVYCRKFFDSTVAKRIDFIQIYKNNLFYRAFKSEKELFQYYFQQRFQDGDIVFNDARLLDMPLLKQTHKTKNVLVFHNSHLEGQQINRSYRFALEHSENVAQYVLLTEMQKRDIQSTFDISEQQITVLPHFIQPYPQHDSIQQQDRFIFIGRLSLQKQVDHLIKAYHRFLSYGYGTRLDVFGADEDKQKQLMLDLINDFGIQDKVTIHDFTSNPLDEFRKSKASLLTSAYEGFGLTVMESIEVGCPVISYDVRYGPAEIIDDGANGYLVEPNNIDAFAQRMADIVKEPLSQVQTKNQLRETQAIANYKQLFQTLTY